MGLHGGIESTGISHVVQAEAIDVSHKAILYLEGVTVSFDGFRALNDLSFSIDVGELRCVIGPNGAGKTTMMDVITGKTRPDNGTVFLGQTLDLTHCPSTRSRASVSAASSKNRRCLKIIACTKISSWRSKAPKGVWDTLFHRRDSAEEDRIDAMLKQINLKNRMRDQAGLLSHGQKQWLEIGMLLIQEPQVLLLDEPAAGMSDEETERTAELFLSLEGKHSLVVVEHDMAFVASLARKVTVLHEGSVLLEGTMDTVQNDERVIEVYLGR